LTKNNLNSNNIVTNIGRLSDINPGKRFLKCAGS